MIGCSGACTAMTTPVGFHIQIRPAVRVALRAVRFPSVDGRDRDRAAQGVLSHRTRFKVIGIHAVPNAAQVIERLGFDGTDQDLIDEAMGQMLLSKPPDGAVTLAKPAPHPEPAASFVVDDDLCADAIGQRADRLRHWSLLHSTRVAARPSGSDRCLSVRRIKG